MNGTMEVKGYEDRGSVKMPAINSLLDASKGLHEVAASVRELADRLCGNHPEAVNQLGNPSSGNFFGQVEDCASDMRELASRIMADVRRIQNRL